MSRCTAYSKQNTAMWQNVFFHHWHFLPGALSVNILKIKQLSITWAVSTNGVACIVPNRHYMQYCSRETIIVLDGHRRQKPLGVM